jgi:hypothetical protein
MLTDLNLLFQGKILYAIHAEKNVIKYESIGERIPCSALRGSRVDGEHSYSLRVEDSPLNTVESVN